MSKHYDKQFKEDTIKYYLEHKELGLLKCAGNLGISKTALGTWAKAAKENHGEVPVRGSGNYSSDEAKEIARLKRELRDTLKAQWVVEAIEKVKKERHMDKPKVMHSNRGIQYTCDAYREAAEGWKLSYSKKAYPWDNACIEYFHAILKSEWINRFRIMDY